MARFVFQLEGVLRHRQNVEDQRQRELAIVQAEMAKMQMELNQLDHSAKGVSEDVRTNHLTGQLDMAFLAAHRRFVLATQRKAMQLAEQMAQQQRRVDDARQKLADAAKQRKMIEKLRERQEERWKADHARRDADNLAEVTMQMGMEAYFQDEAKPG